MCVSPLATLPLVPHACLTRTPLPPFHPLWRAAACIPFTPAKAQTLHAKRKDRQGASDVVKGVATHGERMIIRLLSRHFRRAAGGVLTEGWGQGGRRSISATTPLHCEHS